jgi:DNA-binding protein H-NS
MTELKSYDLPELEALAEQIKAEIVKREQEEQERARQAAEAEAESRTSGPGRRRGCRTSRSRKGRRSLTQDRREEGSRQKGTARKAAEKKAAAEAAKEAAREAAQAAKPDAAAPPPAPAVQPEAPHIRYMHPSNRALTWSGEGTMPDWINAWLVTGGTLYALEIAAEKLAPKPIPESFKLR